MRPPRRATPSAAAARAGRPTGTDGRRDRWPDVVRDPDFVEALARGLDVIACFGGSSPPCPSATSPGDRPGPADRAAPAAHPRGARLRAVPGRSVPADTPGARPRDGVRLVARAVGLARPRLEALVPRTGESSSMAQLDGSDIVYVARVSVPKIIALRVEVGTRFPAPPTSQGKVLLAALPTLPSSPRSSRPEPVRAAAASSDRWPSSRRSWPGCALAAGRSPTRSWPPECAPSRCPVRDGSGAVRAAMNVTVHAAETSTERLVDELPLLRQTAAEVSDDWALWGAGRTSRSGRPVRPEGVRRSRAGPRPSRPDPALDVRGRDRLEVPALRRVLVEQLLELVARDLAPEDLLAQARPPCTRMPWGQRYRRARGAHSRLG